MSDEYRHDLERRWHDETWCAIAGSPECGCGCIPVAEEIARAMCDRIDELEAENRRMREALDLFWSQSLAIEMLARRAYGESSQIYQNVLAAILKAQEFYKNLTKFYKNLPKAARAALSQEEKQ